MMIQQHDGVVVDAAELQQGFAKRLREEDEVLQGEGGAKAQGCGCPPPCPPLYRPPGGAPALGDPISQGGGGQGGGVPPKASGAPPT